MIIIDMAIHGGLTGVSFHRLLSPSVCIREAVPWIDQTPEGAHVKSLPSY